MARLVSLLVLVALCLTFAASARADTPANCMYDDLVGTWTLQLGPSGFDSSLNCTKPWSPVSSYTVTLSYPNKATDAAGNTGKFTIIYNQGVEVDIAGRRYFWFSNYQSQGGKVVSLCSQTFPGQAWVHDSEPYNPSNWACFSGVRQQSKMLATHAPSVITIDAPSDVQRRNTMYQHDHDLVDRINKSGTTWTAAVYDEFLGMTIGQLEQRAGGAKKHGSEFANPWVEHMPATVVRDNAVESATPTVQTVGDLPSSFDWTDVNGVNYVSPVRDQGQCGSCYSFASMAMLEARIRIKTKNAQQPILSPQNIVSCSQYSQGCDGGFSYLIGGKYSHDFGAVEESCFPYLGMNAPCSKRCANPKRYYVSSYGYVGGYYGACSVEGMMTELVNNGPIAVGFEVLSDFFSYKSGVYQHTGMTGYNPFVVTNHAVLVVGYGTTSDGIPFWKVKNSWGTGWGEKGFFRIYRGLNQNGGTVGIESMAFAADPVV